VASTSEQNADGTAADPGRSIWRRPHFVMAVAAQFLYVAAQTGVFSFFINYVVSDMPMLSAWAAGLLPSEWTYPNAGAFQITERAASRLLSIGGFGLFLLGRFTGSLALSWFKAEKTLALFAAVNVVVMGLVMAPLGWVSVGALFASFFFMSIMFPTIFALGIQGLGPQTKKASAFIVMAIVGGAIMPMLMGWFADVASMRVAFVVPLFCFAGIAAYGGLWTRLVAGGVEAARPEQG
jgi:FHS family L-fucose permease-like MFS transporter